jgi:hypothetical protein
LDLTLAFTYTSVTTNIPKKAKLESKPESVVPTGLVKGFVTSAVKCHATAVASATSVGTDGYSNASTDAEFKMGGYENLDGNGNKVVDKKYPKYANSEIKSKGQRGCQVHHSEVHVRYFTQCFTVHSYSQHEQTHRVSGYPRDTQECY